MRAFYLKSGNAFQKPEGMRAVPSGQDTERLVKVKLMLNGKLQLTFTNFQRMNFNGICNIVQLQFYKIEPNNRVAMFPRLHRYCTCDQLSCFVNYKSFLKFTNFAHKRIILILKSAHNILVML